MTDSENKLDNATVRRFAKLLKNNGGSSNASTGITTGTVIQNDNQLYVAVDDETLVPVSDTASNVKVGDKVTLAIDNEEALIVGNNSDASPTASELSETDTKATFAKVDASEAKDTAQTAQTTADNAQSTATEAQSTAQSAQDTATEAKETADAVDGKATEAKETATQAQATATTASETATQAKETAEAVDAKATEAQTTATEANTKATEAQSTATTASETATQAQTTANTAKETADTASTKADNAQSTAEQAISDASDASKVATNYIDFNETNGLVIGDKREGATLTANTQINSEGVHIRDGETVLASFKEDEVVLLNDSDSAQGTVTFGNPSRTGSAKIFFLRNQHLGLSTQYGSLLLHPRFLTEYNGATYDCTPKIDMMEDSHNLQEIRLTPQYLNKDEKETSYSRGNRIAVGCKSIDFIKGDFDDAKFQCKIPTVFDETPSVAGTPVSLEGHTHTKSEITDFAHDHAGDALTPATINTTSTIKQNGTQVSLEGHKHSASDVTSGTLPIARGGTGATTASGALSAIGAAASSHNHSASNITSGTLAVARGGTGKTAGTFYGETVLYNNTTGTNGNVTLSTSAANYTYLEIFYKCTPSTSSAYNSVKVFSPNGKKVQLQQSFFASGTTTLQTDFELVSISTTTITRGTMGYIQHSGSSSSCGTTTRQFNIVRVVGYK